jgi:predicted enzyme related to lactoylglutathione lyase
MGAMSEPFTSPATGPELFMTELLVADWPAQVQWYAETLGLRLSLRDEAGGFALFTGSHGRLALRRGPVSDPSHGKIRLVFQVADVEAECARLAARGVAMSVPRDHPREAYREVRLTDPEGTSITLFCWTSRT